LVKGLDFSLLNKMRGEITKKEKIDELRQLKAQKKQKQKQKEFTSMLARKVWHAVVETLHPHHVTFPKRMQNMSKAISMGQRIRGAPSVFLPGRMTYEFDIVEQARDSVGYVSDIPRIVYTSKEEAPKADWSKKVASAHGDLVARVRETLLKAQEDRKNRKQAKKSGIEQSSYAMAQKVNVIKAKDTDNDIFGGVAAANPFEAARDAQALKRPKSEARSPSHAAVGTANQKTSYFDDAGHEKYRKAPEGQLDLGAIETEDTLDRLGKAGSGQGGEGRGSDRDLFEPAERFMGTKAGWVFKLGTQGLGYYREDSSRSSTKKAISAAAKAAGVDVDDTNSGLPKLRTLRGRAPEPAEEDEDAYADCFPGAQMSGVGLTTADDSDDEEADERAKEKIAKLNKLAGRKEGSEQPDGKKKGEAITKKGERKMSENQQWQKIDAMLKKGNVASIDDLEASSRHSKKGGPERRQVHATPSYF